MKVIYRKATKKDTKVIENLFTQMLFSIYKNPKIKAYKKGYLDRFFTNLEDCVLVAEIDNIVIGYISIIVKREDKNYIYLEDFCVDKNFRNNGIGANLLNMVESYAKGIGINDICLHVELTNALAIKLYEKNGYNFYSEQGNRILMNKIL